MIKPLKHGPHNFVRFLPSWWLERTDLILGLATFAAFTLYGLQFSGPAYLGDEVGYLSKAAVIAGHDNNYSSSYYGGYSFLISPIFAFTTDAFLAWRLVLTANAMLWGISAVILYSLGKEWFPQKDKRQISQAVILSLLYPSWIVISSYAFASSAFIATFLLALYLLQKAKRSAEYIVLAMVSGFLSWIHPLGVPLTAIFACVTLVQILTLPKTHGHPKIRRPSLSVACTAISLAAIITYQRLVHPWLAPSGGHYPSDAGKAAVGRLAAILNPDGLALLSVAGRLNYIIIASLGVAILGFSDITANALQVFRRSFQDRTYRAALSQLALAASFLAILVLTGLNLGNRIDTAIYGRYLEMVLLPILLVGFLAQRRCIALFGSAALVGLSGTFLETMHRGYWNNQVNTIAYWPFGLAPSSGHLAWAAIGLVGIGAGFALSRRAWIAHLCVSVVAVTTATIFHANILDGYSQPTSIFKAIYATTERGECVAVADDIDDYFYTQRADWIQYYLYAYTIEPAQISDWPQAADCRTLLHFAPEELPVERVKLTVARHVASGIFLTVAESSLLETALDQIDRDSEDLRTDGAACVLGGCYEYSKPLAVQEPEIARHLISNPTSSGALATTERTGYVWLSPYRAMGPGEAHIVVSVHVSEGTGGGFDIVQLSTNGILGQELFDNISGWFDVETAVKLDDRFGDIQIRVFAGPASDFTLHGIRVFR